MLHNKEKGISLLFVVLVMNVILAISLGISAIFLQQTKMLADVGYSVTSFYAADSGIEQELYDLYKLPLGSHQSSYQGSINGGSFTVVAKCSSSLNCFAGFEVDSSCTAPNYCLKSTGSYRATKRAIEVKY